MINNCLQKHQDESFSNDIARVLSDTALLHITYDLVNFLSDTSAYVIIILVWVHF
jgi:hypothetical protein